MKKSRYSICLFPSYNGTPWRTNSKKLAILLFLLRSYFGFRMTEVRIIDNLTKEHTLVS